MAETSLNARAQAACASEDSLYRKVFWRLIPLLFGC